MFYCSNILPNLGHYVADPLIAAAARDFMTVPLLGLTGYGIFAGYVAAFAAVGGGDFTMNAQLVWLAVLGGFLLLGLASPLDLGIVQGLACYVFGIWMIAVGECEKLVGRW